MKYYLGAHVHYNNSLFDIAKQIKKYKGNILQIMLSNSQQILKAMDNKKDISDFTKFIKKNNMKVVIHSTYLINLAKNWDEYSWWIKNLILEIKYANIIGAFGVVIHLGKQLNLTKEEAFNNMYSSIIYILNKTKKIKNVSLILETSSGQGSEMCYKLEDLSYFYNKFKINNNIFNRIGICIDSCHIYSAGYDISTKIKVKSFLIKFNKLIGLNNVYLIHFNDSKTNLKSYKDRHAGIGKGTIQYSGLIHFFKFFRKNNYKIILETPNDYYKKEIIRLINIK